LLVQREKQFLNVEILSFLAFSGKILFFFYILLTKSDPADYLQMKISLNALALLIKKRAISDSKEKYIL
jgi:hypothetical protein